MKIFILLIALCSFFICFFCQANAQDTTAKRRQQQISPAQQQLNVNDQQEQRNGAPVINDQQPVNNGQPAINGVNVPLHSPTPGEKDSTDAPLNSQQTAPNGKQPPPHF